MRIKRIFILFLAAVLSAGHFSAFCAENEAEIAETAAYIMSAAPNPSPGSVGGEWAVIGLHRAEAASDSYFDAYLRNLDARMSESGGDLGRRYTEYSRVALALSELGESDKYDLLSRVNDFDSVTSQGINGAIFAIEAKAALGDTDTNTRDRYIDYILSRQNKDGSFGLSENTPDADVTAMAVSALCLQNGGVDIDRAINRAFLYLSSIQNGDGSFSETPGEAACCETTAQVMIAMRRYGLPDDNRFFTKNGNTPKTALERFRSRGGAYLHVIEGGAPDLMAAEQALLAMTEPRADRRTLIYDALWFEANQMYIESARE